MTARTELTKIILISIAVIFSSSAFAAPLEIRISGFRSQKGAVAVSLFRDSESKSFPGNAEKAEKTFYVNLTSDPQLVLKVDDLSPGKYAISLMHDEDGNKKFKTVLGIPREGFGFSLNPKVYFGAPSFKRAAFQSPETTELEIKVRYF